jgi:phospholipid-binding lipoprotein MlaA
MTLRTASLALGAVTLATLLAATPAAAQERGGWLDRFNRQVFELNEHLSNGVDALRQSLPDGFAVPEWLSTGAGNMLSNSVNEPITALSHALSGDFGLAGNSLRRFGTNLTLGILGTRDVATEMGMEVPRNDIGLALCRHGVPDGPYMVLPIVGPRTLRDAIADLVVTNAIIYVALIPVFGPVPGLMTILVIEALDEAAALAIARQIDSAHERGGTYDDVRERYVAGRALRCGGA